MVVQSSEKSPEPVLPQLDLSYLALFLGLRVNQLVMERMTAAGFTRVRESHGFVIQHLIESERTISELAQRMEVTQQAASKVVAELIELGALEAAPGDDRRVKRIRLSKKGWQVVRLGRSARRRIDHKLRAAVGEAGYEAARSALCACLSSLGGIERIQSRRIRQPQ